MIAIVVNWFFSEEVDIYIETFGCNEQEYMEAMSK